MVGNVEIEMTDMRMEDVEPYLHRHGFTAQVNRLTYQEKLRMPSLWMSTSFPMNIYRAVSKFETVGDFIALTKKEVLLLKGIGPVGLKVIECKLKKFKLSLKRID